MLTLEKSFQTYPKLSPLQFSSLEQLESKLIPCLTTKHTSRLMSFLPILQTKVPQSVLRMPLWVLWQSKQTNKRKILSWYLSQHMNLTKLYCQQINEPYLEWQQKPLSVGTAWGERIPTVTSDTRSGSSHSLITGCNPNSNWNLIIFMHFFFQLLSESVKITNTRVLICSMFHCYNLIDLGPWTHLSLKKSPSFSISEKCPFWLAWRTAVSTKITH